MSEFKEVRMGLGISQDEAAKILNISRRTYQNYEKLESCDKLRYKSALMLFKELTKIDEEHGLLTISKIKETVNRVFENYDVKSCYLFGSYAKGKAIEESDVDLLIDSEITGLAFFGLVEDLRENLHKLVDLILLDHLDNNPKLLIEVLKDGIKIYGRDS